MPIRFSMCIMSLLNIFVFLIYTGLDNVYSSAVNSCVISKGRIGWFVYIGNHLVSLERESTVSLDYVPINVMFITLYRLVCVISLAQLAL